MKLARLFLIAGLLVLCVPSSLTSAENGKKLQIELFGGFLALNPQDLNNKAEFDRMYESFFTEDQYQYYHARFGDNFAYSGRIVGEFKKIKNAFPLGFRLRYFMTSDLSVSLGFKTLSRTRHSQVSLNYDVRSINPDGMLFFDEFSNGIKNGPYSLFVEAYVPMAGIHYKMAERIPISFESCITIGPLLARCHVQQERQAVTTDSTEYWDELSQKYFIEGKGIGIALDAGIQLNIKPIRNFELFLEGGYSYQRAGKITGTGRSETTRRDQNSSGYTQTSEWEGQWANVQGSYNREWGNMNFTFPSNEFGIDNFSRFYLDLSGFQIRIGISLTL